MNAIGMPSGDDGTEKGLRFRAIILLPHRMMALDWLFFLFLPFCCGRSDAGTVRRWIGDVWESKVSESEERAGGLCKMHAPVFESKYRL